MKNLTKTLAILITLTAISFTSCQMTEDVLPEGKGKVKDPIGGNIGNGDNGDKTGDDNNRNTCGDKVDDNNNGNSDSDNKGLNADVSVISGLSFLSSFECNGDEDCD